MSVTRFEDLDLNRQYTYADYLTWEFADRVELLRGWIARMSPAPNRFHQEIAGWLFGEVHLHFKSRQCKPYPAPFDVRLPRTEGGETVVQPDICVICDTEKLTAQGCTGAPDWVIEVLSPGNTSREMREKFALYEEAGVREYWVIEPANYFVLRYELRDGEFVGLAPKTDRDERITSVVFPDFSVVGGELFGR